jgi:hypothetical protein
MNENLVNELVLTLLRLIKLLFFFLAQLGFELHACEAGTLPLQPSSCLLKEIPNTCFLKAVWGYVSDLLI